MLRSAMLSAVALLLTVGASSAQNTIIAVDGSSSRGRVRLTRSPSGIDYAVDVHGLPVGQYVTELRPDCDATGEVRAAHRLLLLVGTEGVGSSRALIGKADEVAN